MRDADPGVLDGAATASLVVDRPVAPFVLPRQRTHAPDAVPAPRVRRRVVVDDLAIDHVDEAAAVTEVMTSLRSRRGGLLLTVNIDILRQLRGERCRDVVDAAELVVADGAPLVWASRVLGDPLPERVTGASLIRTLSAAAASGGRRVMLIGGAEGSAERAAAALGREHPGLGEVAWHFPPFGFDAPGADPAALQDLVDAVVAARPDVVFVSLGFPRQERLAVQLAQHVPQAWFVGCGGALAMLAGDVHRAPSWMQQSGLEWVHRMASEPRRLARRYLVDDLPFAVGVLARAATARIRREARRAAPSTDAPTDAHVEVGDSRTVHHPAALLDAAGEPHAER